MSKITVEILEIIDQRKPDLVIVLGDTEDRHENLYLPAHVDAVIFFKDIAKRCELVVLIGNHDRENNSDFLSNIHPFVGLEDYPNITIVYTTVWDKKKNFIYVPYVSKGRFNEALAKVDYYPFVNGVVNTDGEIPKFLFSHQDYMHANMGTKICTDGDAWSIYLPQIFSGHIHKYQILPGICYVGTFMQQTYGEDTDKALMMIYLDEEDTEDHKPKYMVERIRLTSIPMKITVHMDASELPNFASKIPAGCMVKVVINVDATDLASVRQSPFYKAMKNMVDKVTENIVSNKANIAEQLVNQCKEKGTLAPDRRIYNLDEIVIAMLNDDPYALNIYTTEISV